MPWRVTACRWGAGRNNIGEVCTPNAGADVARNRALWTM
jgi:hypothetical protein